MHIAITDPINQAQTAVAGPPEAMGEPYVAGTDPNTPKIEMAYETVDHFVNSRFNSFLLSQHEHSYSRVKWMHLFIPHSCQQALVVIINGRHRGTLQNRTLTFHLIAITA
jgi:hypothetical protein